MVRSPFQLTGFPPKCPCATFPGYALRRAIIAPVSRSDKPASCPQHWISLGGASHWRCLSADRRLHRSNSSALLWTFLRERPEGSGGELFAFCCPYRFFIDAQTKARTSWGRDVSIDRPQDVSTQSLAAFLEWTKKFSDGEIRHTRGSLDGGR